MKDAPPITEAVSSALDKLQRGLSYDPGLYRGLPEARRIPELTVEEAAAVLAEVERLKSSLTASGCDAARYRFLRDQNNGLERVDTRSGQDFGASCYHVVEGVRELKYGTDLDTAIDAAIRAQGETK